MRTVKDKAEIQPARAAGLTALASYQHALDALAKSGLDSRSSAHAGLPFLQDVPGLENLFLSMSAAAPAVPGASDEEWNPLSQRPHSPLPPAVGDELGAEITALKEAVDAFTTLSHEMMHVALWEPFFAGLWKPPSRRVFREFSLMAEGFCFFFSDIVVSGAVRVRLPDGEFALERQTPSNARFHPSRAFQALNIHDPGEILDIYLEGFNGGQTRLWQPRGTSSFAAALASQVYDFYTGSIRYLDELHKALGAFGGFTEFYRRFCAIPGLPAFLDDASLVDGADLPAYFSGFFSSGLKKLADLTAAQVAGVRWRRMLQMRAYYALQVRWLLSEDLIVARGLAAPRRRQLVGHVAIYLDGLNTLLLQLAQSPGTSPEPALAQLDTSYDAQVRAVFLAHDAWVGHRWLIAPHRAGGCINVCEKPPARDREAKVKLLQAAAFVVEELTGRMQASKTVAARTAVLADIQCIAALGASGGDGSAARTRAAMRQLHSELASPHLLEAWSVPMAGFDPAGNRYRELVFSYQ